MKFSIYVIWVSWFLISCAPVQQQEESIHYKQVEGLKDRADSYYNEKKYQEALEYYDQAIQTGLQFQFQDLVALSFNGRGRSYYKMQNYIESILSYEKAIDIYASLNDLDNFAKNVFNLGLTYRKQNINEQALVAYQEAYNHFKDNNQEKRLASVCNEIGLVYKRLNKYEDAIYYYKQSEKIRRRLGDQKGLYKTIHNIGITYINVKDYRTALDYLKKAKNIIEKSGNKKSLSNNYSKLGKAYFNLNDLKKSESYYLKSYQLRQAINYKRGIAESANDLGLLYLKLNKHELSKTYLHTAYQVATEIKYHEELLLNQQYNIILCERENNDQLTSFHKNAIYTQQRAISLQKFRIKQQSDHIATKLKEIKSALLLTRLTKEKIHQGQIQMGTTLGGIAVMLLAGFVFYDKKTKLTMRLDKPLFGLTKSEELNRVFLKETHHRSKNNMMVLSGVVADNLYKIHSKSDRFRLLETQNWYNTIMFVNKKLGNAHEGIITHIDLKEFVEHIIQRAMASTQMHQLHYELNLKKIKIEHTITLPLGLVINEIIARILNDVLLEINNPELSITAQKMQKKRLSLSFKGNAATLPDNTKQNIELLLEDLEGCIIEKEKECIIELQISE